MYLLPKGARGTQLCGCPQLQGFGGFPKQPGEGPTKTRAPRGPKGPSPFWGPWWRIPGKNRANLVEKDDLKITVL